MRDYMSLDALVRARLRKWPQRPPGLKAVAFGPDAWLRARPSPSAKSEQQPYLKLPGSDRLRTLPDGLWLNFGGTPEEPFVDIFAIEACGTLTNLLDKRSRFGASTHSLLAACPLPWLLAPTDANEQTPRWQLTGVIAREPVLPLVLPVRGFRVMYGLKADDYYAFAHHHVAQAHEFFVPMDALIATRGDRDPAMRALVARSSVEWNFLSFPTGSPLERRRALADIVRCARRTWPPSPDADEELDEEVGPVGNHPVGADIEHMPHI